MNMLKPLMHSFCWTAAMHLEIVLQTQGPFEELTWITEQNSCIVNEQNENEKLLKGVFCAKWSYWLAPCCVWLHIVHRLYKNFIIQATYTTGFIQTLLKITVRIPPGLLNPRENTATLILLPAVRLLYQECKWPLMSCALVCQEFECNAEDLKELKELGHGAYGFVYKMIHEPTGNIMAVKVMSDSGQL